MKSSWHIKFALFTGLITGLIVGTIDCIAKIIVFSFEWFEFYQSLLIHGIFFIVAFFVLSLIIELIKKILKLRTTKKGLTIFYTLTTTLFLLLYYIEVFVNRYIYNLSTWGKEPMQRIISFSLGILFGLVYIFLLTKRISIAGKVLIPTRKKKFKVFFKNYLFILIIFIVISFFMDISMNSISNTIPKNAIKDSPNIILITLDTVRADHLSVYDYELDTSPNFAKLAKNSVVFNNAIAPSSWTIPSHASIFTGKYPSNHGAIKTHQMLENKELTLAEILRAKGYNTAGFIGGPHSKARYGFGQGFLTYIDRLDFFEHRTTFDRFNIRVILRAFFPGLHKKIFSYDGERTCEEINKDVSKWLDKNKDSSFFMFINYFDPHDPYNLGLEFREQFTDETRDYDEVRKALLSKRYTNHSKDLIKYIERIYDTEIFYWDYHFPELINKLDDLGILNNTIIIVTADHGEEFYEHGGFLHTRTLYEEVIHVPLIIHYPDGFEPQRIEKRTGITNIFPTILDILEIEIPENIDSESLMPLIDGTKEYERRYVLSQLYGRLDKPEYGESNQQAVSYDNWKIIEVNPETNLLPSSLFDLEKDPEEKTNLYEIGIGKKRLLQKYLAEITGFPNEESPFISTIASSND